MALSLTVAPLTLRSPRRPVRRHGPLPAGERGFGSLEPGHERGVDDARHALIADRPDGEVDIAEGELMGRHQLEREAFRGELLEGELAGPVAVAAGAVHGDEFDRELADREVRKI